LQTQGGGYHSRADFALRVRHTAIGQTPSAIPDEDLTNTVEPDERCGYPTGMERSKVWDVVQDAREYN
jgi:hypothetical protein